MKKFLKTKNTGDFFNKNKLWIIIDGSQDLNRQTYRRMNGTAKQLVVILTIGTFEFENVVHFFEFFAKLFELLRKNQNTLKI